MTTRRAATAIALASLALVAFASLARGQPAPLSGEGPSRGLRLPDRSVTTQSDATSLEINPAGLGFMDNAEALYGLELGDTGPRDALSDQHGLFLGAGGSWIAGGLGMQWLHAPGFGDRFTSYQKYSFAAAIRPSEGLSLGMGLNLFGSATSRELQGQTALDLGAQWRPSPYVGVGLALRDVNQPFLMPGRGVPLGVVPGLAVRLFDSGLVVDNQIEWTAARDALSWTPRLKTEPLDGIGLYARADVPLNTPARLSSSLAITAGLELSMGRTGLQAAATVRPDTDSGTPGLSPLSNTIRLSGRPHRSILRPTGRWIEVDLTQRIGERGSQPLFGAASAGFLNVLTTLEAAAEDLSIDGIVVSVGGSELGYAQAWDVRRRLQALKEAGKRVVVYAEGTSFVDAYLASAADAVWLHPAHPYTPEGIRATQTHYAEALESIGIRAEFLRIGAYKSSPESYVRSTSTPEDVEQTEAYVDALFDGVVEGIATGRDLSETEVEEAIDRIPLRPTASVEQGFVDDVLYRDEIDRHLRNQFGARRFLESGYDPAPSPTHGWEGRAEIAVLYIDGAIIDGRSGSAPLIGTQLTGSETISRTIERLSRDRNVRGVVVRIASPGGSATASDAIYRDLRQLARQKPVVASMGDVAASGGYYVAAGADEIYATPHTLTGSIGIFAGKFSAKSLLNHVGIERSAIKRGALAGRWSLFDAWSDDERDSIAREIHYLYRLFLHQAAQTRPLSTEELDNVARGRVWAGRAAAERKLVDEVGGLLEAIRRAETLAGLEPGSARYRTYPVRGGFLNLPMGGVLAELVGSRGTSGPEHELADTALGAWLGQIARSAALPLLFEAGEPLMLPPAAIQLR